MSKNWRAGWLKMGLFLSLVRSAFEQICAGVSFQGFQSFSRHFRGVLKEFRLTLLQASRQVPLKAFFS